jgi:type I restriction enzyme S subunit
MAGRQLLNDWRVVQFREIADSVTERVDHPSSSGLEHYVGLEHLDPQTLKISRWGSPSDVEATKLRFYPGDVIYARRRAYQRKLGVAEWDGICSAHALVLRALPGVCLPEFLPYFLQSDQFHQRGLEISVGSLSPTINWKTLAIQEFALPSIDVQRATVEALNGVQEQIRAIGKVLVKAADLRSALLDEMRVRNGVQFAPLGDIADVISGESWASSDEAAALSPGSLPIIGISALKPDGHIDASASTYVQGLASKARLFRVDTLTLLVIRTNGNADRIGNVYRATEPIVGHALSAFIFGCRFHDTDQQEMAYEYMRGSRFQGWATSLVAGSTGLKNLPVRELRKMPVPLVIGADARSYLKKLLAVRELEVEASDAGCASRLLATEAREHLVRVPYV